MTDTQWARIEPLPSDRTPKRDGWWRDHREVIDAIAYKFQTGTQWVYLPEKYDNWRGVLQQVADVGRGRHAGAPCVHCAHGPGRRGGRPRLGGLGGLHDRPWPPARRRGPRKGARRASRPTTPSAGPAEDLRVPQRRGRPRTRPDAVLADKAHSSRVIREHPRGRRIRSQRERVEPAARKQRQRVPTVGELKTTVGAFCP
ncbi:transposase [Streptomyces sp. SID8374]|nr:transposase [Streptomyces sp. SID8374]